MLNVNTIGTKLSDYLEQHNISANRAAKMCDMSPSQMHNILNGKNYGIQHFIKIMNGFQDLNILELFDLDVTTLQRMGVTFGGNAEGNLSAEKGAKPYRIDEEPNLPIVNEPASPAIRPVMVTMNDQMAENIAFVPLKAQAGYLQGYENQEYVETLPSFGLPGFQNGTFRAFEVEGHSMLQIDNKGFHPGDITINQYVESPHQIRDGRVYVIVTPDGMLLKRCINRLDGEIPRLICKSDNRSGDYPDIPLSPEQIIEVWEFKANITRYASPPGDAFTLINDLNARIAILEEKMKI
ncbi:MAG: LexA family transcriptional regulator [Roseivirga sp.]|nr:LexA family transcriptional regulator [Roseivirga sp.]